MVTDTRRKQDPLSRLRRRIEEARTPSADRAPTDDVSADDDPLDRLRRRIDEASEPSMPLTDAPGAAAPPLSDLLESFDHARALLEEPVGYLADIDESNPLEVMRRQIERDVEALGRRRAIDLPRETTAEPPVPDQTVPTAADSDAAAVGQEVLAMLEDQPLPGSVRAEAVRRLAGAIDSGDRAEMREVLRLLIQS